MNIPRTGDLFDLTHTLAKPLLEGEEYPYSALPKIKEFVISLGKTLSPDEYDEIDDEIWVAKDATIAETATVCGPVIIGHKTEVRPGAFIRGSALIGDGVVVGNSTEIKNAIIFDNVQIPHYNYVGDSILGYRSHMGAGAVASNFKLDHSNIVLRDTSGERFETGLRKFGVMLADFAEVGCNSVLFPGTIVGRESLVYPLSRVRGIIPAHAIYRGENDIIERK